MVFDILTGNGEFALVFVKLKWLFTIMNEHLGQARIWASSYLIRELAGS